LEIARRNFELGVRFFPFGVVIPLKTGAAIRGKVELNPLLTN
jgi:hypothetical protein